MSTPIISDDSQFVRRIRAVYNEQRRRENDPQLLLERLAEVCRLPWDGKRVTGICRVSSRAQKARGYSLEGQEDEIRKYVDGKSFELDRLYDIVGSGFNWGQVLEALDYAQRKGNAIVVPGIDRFSRQRITEVAEKCKRRGIRLIVLDEGREADPGEIASGEHRQKERSRNTKRGIKTKRKYDPNWGRRSLANDPRKWRIRERIDQLAGQQQKAGRIRKRLQREGWPGIPAENTIREYLKQRTSK